VFLQYQVSILILNPFLGNFSRTRQKSRFNKWYNRIDFILIEKNKILWYFFIKGKVNTLKNISTAMQNELDDQAILLDDLGREMDTADTKMQTVMKKLTKILHMSSGINKQNFFYNDI